jgi:hypothetical protein
VGLPRDSFVFTAVWQGDQQRLVAKDPAMPPGLLSDNTQDYVFLAYAAQRAAYPAEPTGDGATRRDMVASMLGGWHPAAQRLVGQSDPTTVAHPPRGLPGAARHGFRRFSCACHAVSR